MLGPCTLPLARMPACAEESGGAGCWPAWACMQTADVTRHHVSAASVQVAIFPDWAAELRRRHSISRARAVHSRACSPTPRDLGAPHAHWRDMIPGSAIHAEKQAPLAFARTRMASRSCRPQSRPHSGHAAALQACGKLLLLLIASAAAAGAAVSAAASGAAGYDGAAGSSSSSSSSSRSLRQRPWYMRAHVRAAQHGEPVHAGAAAAAAAAEKAGRAGRRLQQAPALGYDPYGFGYYDPYVAGVTPGFVNVDVNRETGLHLDVGGVTLDVSADKNYYGLGIGNIVGIGAARDRGWNFQLGGGNVLDASLTKDAGLGLWILDGLVNINIGPDGKAWQMGTVAARGSMREAVSAAPAPEVQSVVVNGPATAAAAGGVQPTAVVVDDVTTAVVPSSNGAPPEEVVAATEVTTLPEPQAPVPVPVPAPAAAAVPVPGEQAVIVESVDYDASGNPVVAAQQDEAVRLASATPATAGPPAPGTQQAYLAARPVAAAAEEEETLWTTASQYSDTTNAHARTGGGGNDGTRRACEGGEQVWVSGTKFKCKYKRTKLVRVASGLNTYANGVAA